METFRCVDLIEYEIEYNARVMQYGTRLPADIKQIKNMSMNLLNTLKAIKSN